MSFNPLNFPKKLCNFRKTAIILFFCLSLPAFSQTIDLSQFIGPLPLPIPSMQASTTIQEDVSDSMAEILPKAEALKDEAGKLAETVAAVIDIEKLQSEHQLHQKRLQTNRDSLREIVESGTYGFENVSSLRSETRALIDAVSRHARYIAEKLVKIEGIKQTWAAKETSWQNQQSAKEANFSDSLRNVFKEALVVTDNARKSLEGLEGPLVAFQQKVVELQRQSQQQLEDIDKLMAEMRKDLFRKSRPAMFTPTFILQFDRTLWEDFWIGIASFEIPDRRFFQTSGWIFFLQLILIGGFLYLLRTWKNRNLEAFKLGFIINRYWSAAIFLGILLPLPLFDTVPKLLKLFYAGVLTVTASRVVGGVIDLPWRRRLLYIIVTLYLAIQFFTFIALPAPALRLFIALVGFAGALLCSWRARVNEAEGRSLTFIIGVKLGGASLALVFLSQVAGYVAFSNHLLDVTIKTVFLGVIAWMIDLILRGVIDFIFDNGFVRRYELINRHYRLFIKRATMIADTVVVFVAFASMISVWGFFDSTLLSVERILAFGISLQGYRVSLGMLVWAVILVYASLAVSWLVQTVLDEEVYPRRKVEKGVGISINRLINYAFVIVGAVFGLSAIGIELQNLTVVVGALGIGIGFGLQNIVNNFASGLILLFERSIKVGDIVQIRGDWGTIKNLGLRATVVETFDRSEMIVPNSDLVSSTVTNWTLSDRQTRLIIKIGVAYGSDVQKVTRILLGIAQENPFVMKFPEPAVYFMNFASSSLDFELRVWVADIDIRLKTMNQINYEIERLFRENGIEIPFPQQDIHIKSVDEPVQNMLSGTQIKPAAEKTEVK